MPKYINFIEQPIKSPRKTKVWGVRSKGTGEMIGGIKWLSGWRKYAFFPNMETVYEEICLRDIAEFIERVTEEHKQKNNRRGKKSSEYWKKAEETAKEVASWPKWKRDIQIGKMGAKNNSQTKVTYNDE